MAIQLDTFDPTSPDFTLDGVSPVEADAYALQMLEFVRDQELGKLTKDYLSKPLPEGATKDQKGIYDSTRNMVLNVRNNLKKYEDFKTARGEEPLNFGADALNLKRALDSEKLANEALKILKPGDIGFDAILEENGDREAFNDLAHWLDDTTQAREDYTVNHILRKSGYAKEAIDSGAAEIHARETLLKAKEDEPTRNAFLRWGEETTREISRRKKISEEASKAAQKNFLSISDSEAEFEKLLEENLPDLSDEDRVLVRRARNKTRQVMERDFATVKPFVLRLFNTIAKEEGITPKFDAGEYPSFESVEEAISQGGQLEKPEFAKMLAMMAGVAEAHGQEVDGFMTKLGKNFTRALEPLVDSVEGSNEASIAAMQRSSRRVADMFYDRTDEDFPVYMLTDKETGEVKFTEGRPPGQAAQERFNVQRVERGDKFFMEAAKDYFQKAKRALEYSSSIRNWRETVASVRSDSWFVDTFAYGVARSLPEMGAASTGVAGFLLVADAQMDRNMAEFRMANPIGNWEAARPAATIGAAGYAAINRFQFNTLFKGMKNTQGFFRKVIGITTKEAIQETIQDQMFVTAQELTEALGADIPDVELLASYWQGVEKFPETWAAMLPFGLVGGMGGKAMDYLDQKSFEKFLGDPVGQEMAGITEETMARMEGMTTREKMDFIEENADEVLRFNLDPEAMRQMGFNATIQANEAGTFSITDGENTLSARTPEEAAEAAMQLNPPAAQFGYRSEGANVEWADIEADIAEQMARVGSPSKDRAMMLESNTDSEGAPLLESKSIDWELALDSKLKDAGRPIGHAEVLRALVKTMEVVGIRSGIRAGRKMRKGVLGTYSPANGILKIIKHGNVTTAAHEMGHAIQDQYLFPEEQFKPGQTFVVDAGWQKNVPANVLSELQKIANDFYGGGGMGLQLAKNGILNTEGFAEYIRLKLQGEDMAKHFPVADAWFEKQVLAKNKQFAKRFNKAKDLIVKYGYQGSLARAEGNIAPTPTTIQQGQQRMIDFYENFETYAVEELAPLKNIVKEAERLSGTKLEGRDNPYLMGKAFRATPDSIVFEMVEEGMVYADGTRGGFKTSLRYALASIPQSKRQKFAIYLWAKRTEALGMSRDSGLSMADAQKILQELDSPQFQKAADLVYEWNNNILQYAADSSVDYAETVRLIRKFDPGNYIPLTREFVRIAKAYKSLPAGASSGKIVKALKGSGRRIKDPFESMIANARNMILRSQQRMIYEKIIDLQRQFPKLGPKIVKLDPNEVKNISVAQWNIVNIANQIAAALNGGLKDQAKLLAEAIELDPDAANEMVTFWGKSYVPPNVSENVIIPFFIDGKREFYEVDRDVYEAMGGLELYRLPFLGNIFIGLLNRAWRAGTTAFSLPFQIVINPARDNVTLHYNTQSSAGLLRRLGTWFSTYVQGYVESLTGGLYKSDWQKLYDHLNITQAGYLGQDADFTRTISRNLFKGKLFRTVHPGNIYDYFHAILQTAEKVPRLTEVKLLARDMGFDPKKGKLTPEVIQKFNLAAREVTTDFTAAGSVGKVVNQIFPFSNAHVQGVRAHLRAYKREADKLEGKNKIHKYFFNAFVSRGMQLSALSVLNWLRNKDEDWWAEMDEEDKYRYTYIPIPADISPSGLEEMLRIPKAFEADGLFQGMPVAILDSLYRKDPESAVGWANAFLKSMASPALPAVLNYALESAGGEDYFGRTVIPKGEERLDVDGERYRQFGPETTRLATSLGMWFDMSPRRVDHFLESFTGRAGLDAVKMVFGTVEEDIREPRISRFPVLGTLFQAGGPAAYNPKSIQEFYEIRSYALARSSKINQDVPESKEQRALRLMVEDASEAMAIAREIRKVTPEEDQARKLRQFELDVARRAVEQFNAKDATRRDFQKWKSQMEALRSKD